MKKMVLVATMVLAISGISYSQVFQTSGTCVERQCEICDKKITEWREDPLSYSGMLLRSGPFCSGKIVERLSSHLDIHYVCEECRSLYQEKYQKLMSETDKKFMTDAINESLKRRAVNRDINKSDALKKLLDQAKDIERQIKELDRRPK